MFPFVVLCTQFKHFIDTAAGIGNCLFVKGYFLARFGLNEVIHIRQGGQSHIVTDGVLGKGVKPLFGAVKLEVLDYAVFGADDEFPVVAFFGIIHNAGGGTHIVRHLHHRRQTFGVDQHQRVGVEFPHPRDIPRGYAKVGGAAPPDQHNVFFRHLLCHIGA